MKFESKEFFFSEEEKSRVVTDLGRLMAERTNEKLDFSKEFEFLRSEEDKKRIVENLVRYLDEKACKELLDS
jgi:hypothetical protein